MAGLPKELIENPNPEVAAADDALSEVCATLDFPDPAIWLHADRRMADGCNAVAREYVGASHPSTMPFHIMVEGTCWLKMEGREHVLGGGRCGGVSVWNRPSVGRGQLEAG